MAVLAAGVVGQILTRRGDQGVLLAPVGYVAGVAAALTPWPVALIAVVTGFVGLFAFRQFHAFFAFGAATVAILGFVLETEVMWIAPAAGVFALPNLAGLFTGSALELPTRNASRPSPPPRRAA